MINALHLIFCAFPQVPPAAQDGSRQQSHMLCLEHATTD